MRDKDAFDVAYIWNDISGLETAGARRFGIGVDGIHVDVVGETGEMAVVDGRPRDEMCLVFVVGENLEHPPSAAAALAGAHQQPSVHHLHLLRRHLGRAAPVAPRAVLAGIVFGLRLNVHDRVHSTLR